MKHNAIVYCQGAFNTTNGKTAHGLVRFTERYNVVAVVDEKYHGQDAGMVLDGKNFNIPIVSNVTEALNLGKTKNLSIDHLVIGLAPDGGKLPTSAISEIKIAIQNGMNIDSGLHDFLSDNSEIAKLSTEHNVAIRDIRKPPTRDKLHFFCGKIEEVNSLKIAVLGTDSAVGKRTTAWLIVHGLRAQGISAEMVGTGQTAWMQGAKHSVIFDSLVNDFVSGEIEHAVWSAWNDSKPQVIVIEGQGSLMNPAYPSGLEILAAGRPDVVILQHAPRRKEYDGFPGYPIQPLHHQIQAIEVVSGKPVVAITLNHENLSSQEIPGVCATMEDIVGLPVIDVLVDGTDKLIEVLRSHL